MTQSPCVHLASTFINARKWMDRVRGCDSRRAGVILWRLWVERRLSPLQYNVLCFMSYKHMKISVVCASQSSDFSYVCCKYCIIVWQKYTLDVDVFTRYWNSFTFLLVVFVPLSSVAVMILTVYLQNFQQCFFFFKSSFKLFSSFASYEESSLLFFIDIVLFCLH